MKVICDRGALLDAINLVSGVVATRSPRPQLSCVKLDAAKADGAGSLTLTATDAEISLRLTMTRVEVEQTGPCLIPADKFRQIVSAEDNEPTLTLEAEGEDCHISGQDAHFKVLGQAVEDYPQVPEFAASLTGSADQPKAKAVFSHNAGALATLITRTIFATARENSRYAINGVLIKLDGNKLELVATDGRRLSYCKDTIKSPDKDAQPVACIVPSKALSMILKLIDSSDETIRIALTDNQILAAFGSDDDARAVLSSNLVEGTFPPYEEVIPKDQDKKIVFDRDVLASAVRRAALLTNEESRGVRMNFNAEDKALEITSRAPEMGEAQVRVDLASYDGEDIEIGFNPAFIVDALKVIEDPQVIMELKAPSKPGLVRSGKDFTYVVMPVNL